MENLIGKRFGRLIVIKKEENDKYRNSKWLCLCDCGNKIHVISSNLISGRSKSCGCLNIEKLIKRNLKHGYAKRGAKSKSYIAWQSMIRRCTNKNSKDYKNYGGRIPPITVCCRWSNKNPCGFINFLADMGECPKGLSLDRINNDLGYYKENCRWATRKQQQRNKRNNIMVSHDGKNILLKDYCKIKNLNYNTILVRIKVYDWPITEALTIPIKIKKSYKILDI